LRVVAVLCAIVLALPACSSATGKRTEVLVHPSTPGATTSVGESSTVQQWAALVAKRGAPVLDAVSIRKACPIVDQAGDDPTCRLTRGSFVLIVDRFGIYIGDVSNPLGDPPVKVADLVQRTVRAADAIDAVQENYVDACSSASGVTNTAQCDTAQKRWAAAVDDLVAVIAAWEPLGN
jgi:hypothetical protein